MLEANISSYFVTLPKGVQELWYNQPIVLHVHLIPFYFPNSHFVSLRKKADFLWEGARLQHLRRIVGGSCDAGLFACHHISVVVTVQSSQSVIIICPIHLRSGVQFRPVTTESGFKIVGYFDNVHAPVKMISSHGWTS